MSDRSTPITRRSALRAGSLFLGAGLLAPIGATSASAQPAEPIDRAEALMLELERLILDLDGESQADVMVELDRLGQIAGSADPAAEAESTLRLTGENRSSLQMERAHARAHSEIIPRYGVLIAAAVAARKAHRPDWQAADAAEAEAEKAYADQKAADAERLGHEGWLAWHVAWSFYLFGYCEECRGAA